MNKKIILIAIISIIIIMIIILFFILKPTEKFDFSYITKLWQTSNIGGDYILFPEKCMIEYSNRKNVGIAVSGGGSRSFTSTLGYVRALQNLGFFEKTKYISTVSGGGWFVGTYLFAKKNYSNKRLLGEGIKANEMTTKNLTDINYNDNIFIGNRISDADFVYYGLQGLVPGNGVPLTEWWSYIIGRVFLQPYGLFNSVVTLNEKYIYDIKNSNKNLNKNIACGDINDPFWICNTTLQYKSISQSTGKNINYPNVVFPFTPLYSGLPQTLLLADGNYTGGVVTETFSFGSNLIDDIKILNYNGSDPQIYNSFCSSSQNTNVGSKLKDYFTLSDMIGMSSAVFAGPLYAIINKLPASVTDYFFSITPSYDILITNSLKPTISDSQCKISGISGCNAEYGYDPSSCKRYITGCYSNTAPQCKEDSDCSFSFTGCKNTKGGSSSKCNLSGFKCKCDKTTTDPYIMKKYNTANAQFGDGGNSDNTGIVSLVSRGVEKIICFYNSELDIFTSECDPALKVLFGGNETCASYQLTGITIQIFELSEFNPLIEQLKASNKAGGPTYARKKLKVLPNKIFGVQGNYVADILFIGLSNSTRFMSELKPELRKEIEDEKKLSPKIRQTKFANFPNYSTFFPSVTQGTTQLSKLQVNLLSSYTEWIIYQPEIIEIINDMYK